MNVKNPLPCSHQPTSGPYPEPQETNPLLVCILISPSHLTTGVSKGFLLSGFPTKVSYAFLVSAIHCPSYRQWFAHPNTIWWKVRATEACIIQFALSSWHFLILCPNIPLSLCFFLRESRSFTPNYQTQVTQLLRTTKIALNYTYSARTAQETHPVSVIKINQLILCGKIIAVCSNKIGNVRRT